MDDPLPKYGLQRATDLPATKNNSMNQATTEATIFILSWFVHSNKLFTFFSEQVGAWNVIPHSTKNIKWTGSKSIFSITIHMYNFLGSTYDSQFT
jgi:hypothetical protein